MSHDAQRLEREAETRRQETPISASCTLQGKLLTYKIHHLRTAKVGAKRGDITDFSRAARLRMLKDFHRIDFTAGPDPLFITLTYPDRLATPDLDERNIHRKVFARHLERITGRRVGAAWRVEWVQRKSGDLIGLPCPHWHLLVFNEQYIHHEKINEAWASTIGENDYVRTEIKRVDERGAVQLYMAKYIAKDALPLSLVIAAYQNKLGRAYGWLRKDEIPWHPEQAHPSLSDRQRRDLMTLAVENLPLPMEGLEQSFSLMGEEAEKAAQILQGNPLTDDHATR